MQHRKSPTHPTPNRHLAAAAALLALAGPPALAAAGAPALTVATPGTVFDSTPYSLGFAFTLQADVVLTALGVWDADADGLPAAAQVGLWRDGDAQPLVLSTITAGTTAVLDGGFRWQALDPLASGGPMLLASGQRYVVAAYLDGGLATSIGIPDANAGLTGSGQIDSRLTLVEDRFADGFFALAYPAQSDHHGGGAWLGANLQMAAVPEPTPASLLAAGLATLGWLGRRRR